VNKWNANYIPDLSGKLIIITGATSGLGLENAKVLTNKNASVVLAVRDVEKANAIKSQMQQNKSKVVVEHLDLTSLNSVEKFSDKILSNYVFLDVLINNAGIMACPYSKTQDGFEIQMGTNHLGHFVLTAKLFPLLRKTKNSRIVNVSSIAHSSGNIDFDDINWEKRKYRTWNAYGDSKLANLLFTYALARKLQNSKNSPLVVASHPGYSATDLQRHTAFFTFLNKLVAQHVKIGALANLRAAFDPKVKTGDYIGSPNFSQLRGHPEKVKSNRMSQDINLANKLWNISEELTKTKFKFDD